MIITPTTKQIDNCERMGWAYQGLGLFARGDDLGHFTVNGWERL